MRGTVERGEVHGLSREAKERISDHSAAGW